MIDQKTAPYAALILRVASGVMFLAHAYFKVYVATIPGITGYFESLGLPGFFVYLVLFAEIFGGAALVLGVATRAVSLALLPLMLGVVWAHSGNGWMVTGQSAGWEYPAFWLVAQVSLVLLGGGAYALKLPAVQKVFGQYA
ncbi:MAG: DoxX family protein [Cypionkella sp.]